ncbi:MAG: radical SAM/SPASM domain-containing protein [Nitrospirota bacterium]
MKRFLHFLTSNRFKHYLGERLRYLTLKKAINIVRVEWAFFFKRSRFNFYPYEIIIDPANICQLRCALCSTGTKLSTRKRGYMKFTTFKKIIDEVAPYVLHIYLHNWGESLLHKEIVRFIRYAKRYKVAISISSNLSFPLTEEEADSLITSGLDTLVISIDGINKETYARYRIGGDFDRVIANARLLVERKMKLNSKSPFLEWQFLKMRHNIHEVETAREMAKELGVDNIAFGSIVLPFGMNDAKLAEEWFPEEEFKNRRRYDMQDSDMGRECWWLWRAAVFNWDGTVSPCCYVDGERAIFGNILDGMFKDIWNNNAYISARSMFSKGNPSYLSLVKGNRTDSHNKDKEKVICMRCGIVKK